MAVTKKDLYVSQIIEDLSNGLTWLKKDDLGFGSIEERYGANEKQIMMIRKHPALKDAETSAIIFNLIDDTKDGTKASVEQVETTNSTTTTTANTTGSTVDSEHSEEQNQTRTSPESTNGPDVRQDIPATASINEEDAANEFLRI